MIARVEAEQRVETITARECRTLIAEERRQKREAVKSFVAGVVENDHEVLARSLTLLDYGGWSKAFRAVVRLGRVHPEARKAFLQIWLEHGDNIREEVGHDLTLIEGLRLLLPPYGGPAQTLYRGDSWRNRQRRTYGTSWTDSLDVAHSFASGIWRTFDGGSVVLEALAPPDAIVCAPALCDDCYGEREFIVDRRRLKNVRVIERFGQGPPDEGLRPDQLSTENDRRGRRRCGG